jgi:hypothetical protein
VLHGLAPLPAAEGRSLVPLLRGEALAPLPAVTEHKRGLRVTSEEFAYLVGIESAAGGAAAGVTAGGAAGEAARGGTGEVAGGAAGETARGATGGRRGSERLYDRRRDPAETRDVAAAEPEALAQMRRAAREHRGRARPDVGPAAPELPVDARTRDALRALGYLDAPGD